LDQPFGRPRNLLTDVTFTRVCEKSLLANQNIDEAKLDKFLKAVLKASKV
jgi:hypothetical protein